jgi:hypothetical protein
MVCYCNILLCSNALPYASSAKVPKSGEVRQGPRHLSRPSNACRDARPIHQCLMSHLYSSRKAFLESSNLTAALRGIARLVLSGLMEKIGFCGRWCVIVIFQCSAGRRRFTKVSERSLANVSMSTNEREWKRYPESMGKY